MELWLGMGRGMELWLGMGMELWLRMGLDVRGGSGGGDRCGVVWRGSVWCWGQGEG